MSVATFLAELRSRDIQVWPDGDQLRCNAPVGALTPDLRDALRQRKGDIVQFLQSAAALASQQRAIVPLQPRGSLVPIYGVPGHNGDVFSYRALVQHLGDDQPFFGLQTPGLGAEEPFQSVVEIAAYFAEQVQSFHKSGPLIVAGYCAGATIAFELARQLRERGMDVQQLVMFAGAFPSYYRRIAQMRERLGLRLRGLRRHARVALTRSMSDVKAYVVERLDRIRNSRSEAEDPLLARRDNLKRVTAAAVSRYEPRRFDRRVSLLIPSRNAVLPRAAITPWTAFAAESVEYCGPDGCEGDAMLLEPHAPAIAVLLRAALRHPERSEGTRP